MLFPGETQRRGPQATRSTLTRAELLERAQREREQRETQRMKATLALSIEACARAKLSRIKVQRNVLADFDCVASASSPPTTKEAMEELLCKLLFGLKSTVFGSHTYPLSPRNALRVISLARLLALCFKRKDTENALLLMTSSELNDSSFFRHFRWFTLLCSRVLPEVALSATEPVIKLPLWIIEFCTIPHNVSKLLLEISSPHDTELRDINQNDCTEPCNTHFNAMTIEPGHSASLSLSCSDNVIAKAQTICSDLSLFLIEKGLLVDMRLYYAALVSTGSSNTAHSVSSRIVNIVARLILEDWSPPAVKQTASSNFFWSFFAMIKLDSLPPSVQPVVISCVMNSWELIVASAQQSNLLHENVSPSSSANFLVENLIRIVPEVVVKFSYRAINFMPFLLQRIPDSGNQTLPSALANAIKEKWDQSVIIQIAHLVDGYDENSPIPAALYDICRLFCLLTDSSELTGFQNTFLNALATSTKLPCLLWSIIRESNYIANLFRQYTGRISNNNLRVVHLWLKLYSWVLRIIDDEEFSKDKLVRQEEVPHLVTALKNAACLLYSADKLYLHLEELKGPITVVLRQLYDRNCRLKFCDPQLWEAPSGLSFSPNILSTIPFVLPFNRRVKLFEDTLEEEKASSGRAHPENTRHVVIRRNYLVDDAFSNLNPLGPLLKGLIRIEYINENGLPEAGIDGGGLTKDFLTKLASAAFDPRYGLFQASCVDRALYPSTIEQSESRLNHFKFLGRILGKCLYERILIDLPISKFFLAKILGKEHFGSPLNDLSLVDQQFYKNLKSLKYISDVESLNLNFVVVENSLNDVDECKITELVPNGTNMIVTNENKERYIHLLADYIVNLRIKKESAAFLAGLNDLIHPEWLYLFNEEELQLLISGSPLGIDILDWRSHTKYAGVYHDSHPVINWFWECVASMGPKEQADLLTFSTGCPRPPLLGFGHLQPSYCIQSTVSTGMEADIHLPTASTCMNLLKLPQFSSPDTLKQKVLYAVQAGAGFELS
ncbi:E3 ubiquitin-ligase UPL7 [Pelomyxa schiedti]|nr:E3 ubiquitin-ligase UPL7 [Pelomyxa schiedti]